MPSMQPTMSVSRCDFAGTLAMGTFGSTSCTLVHFWHAPHCYRRYVSLLRALHFLEDCSCKQMCCSCLASISYVWPLCLAGRHQGQHCSHRHRARRCFCTLHDNSRSPRASNRRAAGSCCCWSHGDCDAAARCCASACSSCTGRMHRLQCGLGCCGLEGKSINGQVSLQWSCCRHLFISLSLS